MSTLCPKCSDPLKPRARFCPRCGETLPAPVPDPPAVPMHPSGLTVAHARREIIIGWIMLVLGLGLFYGALFRDWGWFRVCFSIVIGAMFLLLALGSLVGTSTPADKKAEPAASAEPPPTTQESTPP